MYQAEKERFQTACAQMLGALDALQDVANRGEEVSPFLPPRSMQIQAQNLRSQIEGLYSRVFATSVAEDAQTDADLATLGLEPLQAEDFDHFPPTTKSQS